MSILLSLWGKTRDWLMPPKLEDDQLTIKARILYIINWTMIIALTPANIFEFIVFPELASRWMLYLGLVDIFCLFILFWVQKGKIRTASYLTILGAWGLITIFTYSAGGIRAPIFAAYFVVIFMTGIILGGRAGLVAAAGCGLTGLGLVYFEEIKWIPPLAVQHTPFTIWVVNFTFFLIMAVLQLIASVTIESAHNKTRLEVKERRKVEVELRASEEKFRAFIEQALEGFILLDEQGNLIEFNLGIEKITGLSRQDVIGKSYLNVMAPFLPPEQQTSTALEQIKNKIDQSFLTGQSSMFDRPYEGILYKPDEENKYIRQVTFPIKTTLGYRVGVIISDITERKKAEEEIRRFNADLEKRVQQRTTQLTISNQELEAFSYSISHDLRAPLRTINGFSQILMEEYHDLALDETAQIYLYRIRNATQNMGQLIDDLLKLSHVTRSGIQLTEVDLSRLGRDLLTALRLNNPDRQVEIIIPDHMIVQADASLMRIAMDNLLTNAWKYTQRCTLTRIEIGKIQKDSNPIYYIRDNGAGFNMNFANKLFGTFQRLHTDKDIEGTGIGLAIVHRIISRHGGTIWAEGVVNHGATFYFTLPY